MTASDVGVSQPYFDQRIKGNSVFVLPGHHFVQREAGRAISTLLGSCVSACIRHKHEPVGGLNHFLLPDGGSAAADSARYGVHAMEVLINDILKFGLQKSDLVAKIFGGAAVIATAKQDPVGEQNSRFVRDYLRQEGIPILAEDLGGERARRIYFFTETGKVSVLSVAPSDAGDVRVNEEKMRKQAKSTHVAGGIELF